jgi:ABC-type glycerol-3-phosphate transport system substrate-binding protein
VIKKEVSMRRRTLLGTTLTMVTLQTAAGCDTRRDSPPFDLEVAATWSGAEQSNFEAVLHEFTRRTNVRVRYTSGGNDLPLMLNSRLLGGAPPDVALIPQPGVVAEFAQRGVLTELTSDAAAAVKRNYSPFWQQLATINGRLYGLFFKVANKSVIWYRTDSFAEAGAEPPQTWKDFEQVSQALTDAGITPMVAAGADGWVLADWFSNAYLRIGGPTNYDKLSKHQIHWTDPTVVRTLELLEEYWRTPRFIQGDAVQETFTQAIADVFGERPTSAMLFEGDFVVSEIDRLNTVKVGDGARFFDWPAIHGSPPAVITAGDQAVMFRTTPESNALMAFLASPDAAAVMASHGGYLSANMHMDMSAYPDDITRRLASEVVQNAPMLRFGLSDLAPMAFGGSTSAHMWVLLQKFISSTISPAEMAQKLEDAAAIDFMGS